MLIHLLPRLLVPLLLSSVLPDNAHVAFAAPDTVAEGRINGGENAQPGRYPYIVSLQNVRFGGSGHSCGGSLIAPDIILTAARCMTVFARLEDIAVRVGPYSLREPIEGSEVFPIVDFALHPQFYPNGFGVESLLLKLDGASFDRPLICWRAESRRSPWDSYQHDKARVWVPPGTRNRDSQCSRGPADHDDNELLTK